ncbi:cytochrome P450 [Obba rivulosa]|uniref:Cytochrome P450 n=1 Tax=Obba rivulosa TaxID=1052685 RepID=A0A8E2DK24_9APHY|nr:cytochrome P450 [Obba rivulosa]
MEWTIANVLVGLVACIAVYASLIRKHTLRNHTCPPGPQGWPVIGNMLDIPREKPWETYIEWSKKYGPIVHMEVFGQPMMVLNTAKAAYEILDARSANYSDRTGSTMVSLLHLSWNMVFLNHGPVWRKYRRLMHKYFNDDAIKTYQSIQRRKAHRLLSLLSCEPDKFAQHSRFTLSAALLEVVYGTSVNDPEHRYLKYAQNSADAQIEAFLPGNMVVEFLPILQYMPSWFPGAGFKRMLPKWREDIEALRNSAFRDVQAALSNGSANPSVVSNMLEEAADMEMAEIAEEEIAARDTSAIIYGAGADTVYSTIQTFFFAMVFHPEAQKRAQEELLRVVGSNRLPDFSDRESLPYVVAIMKECSRWIPVLPLGVPHVSTEDDQYEGYYIAKGTVVMANQWAILHDPEEYSQPEAFKPERFIKDGKFNPNIKDPYAVATGFGRRKCPGRFFGEAALFINIASILHIFDISAPVDTNGRPMYPDLQLPSGLVVHPTDFNCTIRPRSSVFHQLIHEL